ncbi:MAG: 2Fe-2S iron-sulfur cluster binding domain-containing protein [Polaromonas sp.]|nr:2Fe-2S iron-sulfur cluster binding domain-containing protein [Polaromonas sp.]
MPVDDSTLLIPKQPNAGATAVFRARIGWQGPNFKAPASLPLLQAAELAGQPLTGSCRNGTCRDCMCQLASGKVVYRIEWPGLSAEEKQAGSILPCVAYPASDVVLLLPS